MTLRIGARCPAPTLEMPPPQLPFPRNRVALLLRQSLLERSSIFPRFLLAIDDPPSRPDPNIADSLFLSHKEISRKLNALVFSACAISALNPDITSSSPLARVVLNLLRSEHFVQLGFRRSPSPQVLEDPLRAPRAL